MTEVHINLVQNTMTPKVVKP